MSGLSSPQALKADLKLPNGTANGKHNEDTVPELPHVTNNILPLSNILRYYTQEAFKQLSRLIENLANTKSSESDASRKKKFLELIISLRRDFIKIYTLVKWAQNLKDISKLIDLLNWLRSQEFYFENLGYGLNELNGFSGAKLPNSDILTSLEVLVKGRPQLPSYNFISKPKVSPEKILEVMHDLNLTLMTRMALTLDMPRRFHNNYEIKDGRVIITIPSEFQVSITVANDLIIDNDEDYYKSPFFFIDFAFLFGINPDTSLITHKDSKIITRLPKSSREKLESVINLVLLKQSLNGLYDVLHKYAISFKLYLISRQLRDLSVNSKWRNNIQFKYSSSLIIINYWSNHYLSKNWKSFIEIGIDKKYNLNFRWFKNGKYNLNHDIQDISGNNSDPEEADDLSVDSIMNLIINKHSEILMSKIYNQLLQMVPNDSSSFINSYQLLIKLTPRKSTILAINPLTGFFYFMEPSPIEVLIQNKINSQPTQVKNKNFITEQDMINNVVNNLIQLRLETFNKALNNKLVSTEWIANDIIKLNDYEIVKLFNFIVDEKASAYNKIQFYRCRNWPSSWFLVNLISGLTSKTYWWVARLRSIKGEWKIQWVQKLKFGGEEDFDYEFFKTLSKSCSSLIVDHMIVEELQARRINYVKVEDESVLDHFDLPFYKESSSSNYRSIVVLHNTGQLLPISVSSTSLFLLVLLVTVNNSTKMNSTICGSLRNLSAADAETTSKLNVKVDTDKENFEILSSIDLSNRMLENNEGGGSNPLLGQLFNSLEKLNLLILILHQLRKTDVKLTNNSLNEITFTVDPCYQPFHLLLPQNDTDFLKLVASEDENPNIKMIIRILNEEIAKSHTALVGSIRYLEEFVPIYTTAKVVRNHLQTRNSEKLSNGLPRLQFEVKYQSLNLVQFVYYLNSINSNAPKKVQKDKISFAMTFTSNKFDKDANLVVKFSMKENLNTQNLKFKSLFEQIFKAANELQKEVQEDATKLMLLKLNYDFLVDKSILEKLLLKISDCFLAYSKTEASN